MRLRLSTTIRRRGRARTPDGARRVLVCHPGVELYGSDRMAVVSAAALHEAGWDCRVMLPSRSGGLPALAAHHGLPVSECKVFVLRKEYMTLRGVLTLLVESLPSFARACLMIRKHDPDVVYVNTITQPAWMLAALVMRRQCVVHAREGEGDSNSLVRALLVAPLTLTSLIICNSRSTEEFIRGSMTVKRPTTVIHNGKNWTLIPPREALPARGPINIVCVGRLSPRKGQDVLLDAVAELSDSVRRNIRIHLVGDVFHGYEWFVDELTATLRQRGLLDTVHFHGFLADVTPVLITSHIAVVPSRIEPFGSVALEAMAAGLPVVVSDAGGLTEIVEDEVTGLVVARSDAHGLSEAIRRLIEDPDLTARLARAGHESVAQSFSLDAYAGALARSFDGVVSRATGLERV